MSLVDANGIIERTMDKIRENCKDIKDENERKQVTKQALAAASEAIASTAYAEMDLKRVVRTCVSIQEANKWGPSKVVLISNKIIDQNAKRAA